MRNDERALERIKAQFDLSLIERIKNPGLLFPVGTVILQSGDICTLSGGLWQDMGSLTIGADTCRAYKRIK